MIWHRTMGSIYWPSNTGIRSTDETTFIQCVDDQEPNIQKLRCLGLDNITKDVHSTAQVEVVSGTMGKFTIDYLSENGRSIQIIRQLSINDSVQFLRIPDFVGGIGLSFLPNLKYPVESIVWGNGGTSNHNWGGSSFGLYITISVSRGASIDPRPDYLLQSLINSRAAARSIRDNFLCCRRQECFRSPSNICNPILNPWVHRQDDGREGLVNQQFLLKLSIPSVCNLSLPISSMGKCLQIA